MHHHPTEGGHGPRSLVLGRYDNGETGVFVVPGIPRDARIRVSRYLESLFDDGTPSPGMPDAPTFEILLVLGVSEVKEWYYVLTGEDDEADTEDTTWFQNHYRHCGQEWTTQWSCQCNDRCPRCNAEIEPYNSVELTELEEGVA